ncbi:XylR N-terminal domain-containing protein [Rhizobium sp. AN70]|uniref:XylR N-terminal domain-containing protein n=1 Tax=Rhizobium sp. AN70 TaxID=3035123 RepID=UPI00247B1082|nr:XylR N-terminal domain-containing protein [Rhizobium sp. AN70]MDH7803287.1 transcriptional regulator with AAA-type ATPase domain [Rhizobium sp. AN70]
MKINGDQEALLDRGGHPTLRELLAHLVFNPVNGVLRLGNTRMVLQRTSFLSHLREEIVRNYGREDAFALLIRLGFQAGVEDSRFVQASWPNIDPGDAFTAGTRLHTVSGITRVETVHNDFDFKKGKFSGEFLWHESAEASEHRKHYGDATEPVCWSLVGYASGYATHSLGKLIVYKETECKAMGHKHCRVVGKPADAWGENDPAVQLFRRQIMPRYLSEEIQSRAARPKPLPSKFDASARFDLVVLAPVRDQIEASARSSFPVTISGPVGSGKSIAANHIASLAAPGGKLPEWASGHGMTLAMLRALLLPPATRSGRKHVVLLQDVEHLDAACQAFLENHLRSASEAARQTLLIILTEATPAAFASDPRMRPALRRILSRRPIMMPSLSARRDEIAVIALALKDVVAEKLDVPVRDLDATALARLASLPMPENLVSLEAVLANAQLEVSPLKAINAAAIARADALSSSGNLHDVWNGKLQSMAEAAIETDGFELEQLNQLFYQLAIDRADGNVAKAAQLLGLTRPQLAYRLRGREA